jgi:mannan endo-1,4-beta-mannosidase
LSVNGVSTEVVLEANGGKFGEADGGKIYLKQGENTIKVLRGWGYFKLDYVRLEPTMPTEILPVTGGLTDAHATEGAKKLYAYLQSIYGTKTLSGQHGLDESRRIVELTGKTPAILSMDFMDYSPSRVEHGATPQGSSERWIAYEKQRKCIMALMWHWNAPTDLIDNDEHKWWSGFYTNATTFDVEAALADPNSDRYKLLIRDMDTIAAELKKFQDAGIPVLWRPMHEASGGWFWWGAKGPEAFKKLWRLMHDRYVNHWGLHNLIWVYTHDKPGWYPGDDVVDIVGMDQYEAPGSYMGTAWASALKQFNGKKMLELAEVGAVPNAAMMRKTGARWLSFTMWSGDFVEKVPKDFLKAVYTDADVINLDGLPWVKGEDRE